jgi:hypothetical protein
MFLVHLGVYFISTLCFFHLLPWNNIVLGAERGDVWNALWSFSWFGEQVLSGNFDFSTPLNHPSGGRLWMVDMVNGMIMIPLMNFFSLPTAHLVLCVMLSTLLGTFTHHWVEEIKGSSNNSLSAWVSGLGLQGSSVVLSAVHNGSSEAMSGCWTVLALWMFWRLLNRRSSLAMAIITLFIGMLSSWYSALICSIFIIGMLISSPKEHRLKGTAVFLLGLIVVVPFAFLAHQFSTEAGNLIRIKDPTALLQVRRTIGVADPLGYILPNYRSPDFRYLSRFGEQFVHATYIGWSLLFLAFWGRKKSPKWLFYVACVCAVLSLGPVLVIHAEPVWLTEDMVIPLPYLALENLWGFDKLSLLVRLSFGVQLAICLMAAFGTLSKRSWLIFIGVVGIELMVQSSLMGFPKQSSVPDSSAALLLSDAPDGGVMFYPNAAARPFLFWQRSFEKPVAASLNFPMNASALKIWSLASELEDKNDVEFKKEISRAAEQRKIRYLFVYRDTSSMPDSHFYSSERILRVFGVFAEDSSCQIARLW